MAKGVRASWLLLSLLPPPSALGRDRGLTPVDGAQVCACSDPGPPDSSVFFTHLLATFLNRRLCAARVLCTLRLAEKRFHEGQKAGHAALLVCTPTANTPHMPHGHPLASGGEDLPHHT